MGWRRGATLADNKGTQAGNTQMMIWDPTVGDDVGSYARLAGRHGDPLPGAVQLLVALAPAGLLYGGTAFYNGRYSYDGELS